MTSGTFGRISWLGLALCSLSFAQGCYSQLHRLSDAEARDVVLTKIPFDTPHDEAAAALKALGPDDVNEAWVGWPPPAESNMTAQFDKWSVLLESGAREVTIHLAPLELFKT